jgi:uncharacterized protein (TIRG00374 family)
MTMTPKHRVRSLVINTLLIALAFGLLALVIWKNRSQIREVLGRPLDPRLFALAFVIYLTGVMITFVRWYWLVRVVEPAFRLSYAILLGFIGIVFNLVIPGAVGGDLIKAAYLMRMKVNKTQAVATMVIDRILGLMGLFLLASIAGAVAWPIAPPQVKTLILVAWAAFGAGLLTLYAIFDQSLTRRYPSLLTGHGRLSAILTELKQLSETYRGNLGLVAAMLALSAFCHGLFVVAFYTVSRTIFPTRLPSLAQHFLMVPLTLFTTAVPLPFGALGLTEEASEQMFRLVSHPGGALAMMGFRVLMYAGALVGALVYLANLRQVRGLTEAAGHLEHELLEGDLDEHPTDLQDDHQSVLPQPPGTSG